MEKVQDIILNKYLIKKYKKEKRLLPCLFLDRDGVIIKDCHYIKREEEVELEKGAFKVIKRAFQLNWIIVIITNQSGIKRGILTWDEYYKVTKKIISFFDFGNPFAAIYSNSLISGSTKNSWRKPSPKMIFQASNDLPIDFKRSILIGDRVSDIRAGFNAGIPKLFHVKTGHGEIERKAIFEDKTLSKKINLRSNSNSYLKLINSLEEFPIDILN